MVVIVFGLPGSGKSFFASRLAERIDAQYVNSDRVRKELFEKREYSQAEKKAVYDKMLSLMKAALNKYRHVILDATFHKKETRDLFADEIGNSLPLQFIEVKASDEIIKERLKHKRPYSEADYEVHQIIRRQNEPLTIPHLILQSTNDNIDDMLEKAITHLNLQHDE